MIRSLRGRILLLLIGVLSALLALMAVWSYRDAQHEIEEILDAQLLQSARFVAGLAGREMNLDTARILQSALDRAASPVDAQGQPRRFSHEYEGKLAFAVFDAKGEALVHSASAPLAHFRDLKILGRRGPGEHGRELAGAAATLLGTSAGFHDAVIEGSRWNIFLLDNPPSGHWILVGDRDDVRGELATNIAFRSMVPELIGVPLVALLVWLVVGWTLRPLAQMTQRLKARDATDLAPLVLERLPDELEPVAASLNRLLANVTELLDREKRFLSYAAHELRTPLAVLRVQADNAVRAADPADREAALAQLDRSVSRATRLVEQLLALARLEPGAADLKPVPADLLPMVRDEIAELSPLALDRGLEITLQADESADHRAPVDGHAMQVLLQNLISNAVRHAPPAGRVQVRLVAGADSVELHVEDSGPGVPAEQRERVFERFYSEGPSRGAGLGLAIVARIVELHRGRVELRESALGGLDAVVTLERVP